MEIWVESRRKSAVSIGRAHPGALIIDVTSRTAEPWVRFSPFYPHGGIPVPLTPGRTGQSVEGIWQALKVFESADVDPRKLEITTMRGIKRTVRANGPVRGHRAGLEGKDLLPYETARRQIYLPAYTWVLDNKVADLVDRLQTLSATRDLVLLDYTTNGDVTDLTTPLSHAALIKAHLKVVR